MPEKGKIYVRIEGGSLHYRLISLAGEDVTASIRLENLNCPLTHLTHIDALKPFRTPLLKITSKRTHTHPEACISALNTYNQSVHNLDWVTRSKNWQVVRLALRLLPPPPAQQICEEDILNQDKNFHHPLRRTFQFYKWRTGSFQTPPPQWGVDIRVLYLGLINFAGEVLRAEEDGLISTAFAPAATATALSALCETRTKDVKMLGEQLLAAVQKQDNLAADFDAEHDFVSGFQYK